ncbi:aminotransferase family protein [Mesorhizobium shangrilense]|uniref:Aminotransferase class III-fold pyridoxal phosphate-dependent enzyme n=1 Tax=Mesorhizobium shangrilense TaxID=460060 RepID=A0ABV2DGP6_9HYPH
MTTALLKHPIGKTYPIVSHGKGVFLYDVEGKDYIDGSSGAMTANIGHGVEEIADVMRKQASEVAFAFFNQFSNKPAEDLATKLASLAPGNLNWVSFVNSGSEASEYAIRLVLNYWRSKGLSRKVKILGRHTSYHGVTMGAVSMSGHATRRADYGPLLHPFPVVPPAYAYRYAGDLSEADYARKCAQDWEDALLREGIDTVAAVIVEPIVGAAGGVLMPPAGYFTMLREICDRLGVLLIMDEVITGLGRTGAWFASIGEGIVPDIITTGKGTSAGYAPMAAIIVHEHIIETLRQNSAAPPYGHTFSGNPVGAAVSLAVLNYVEREKLLENANLRGEELKAGLEAFSQRYSHMVDVRGRGLLWGFEFVMDRASRRAPDESRNTSATFVADCFDNGLIVYPAGVPPLNNAVIISPPLIISGDEVQELLRRLDTALATMDGRIDGWVREEVQ